MKIIIGSEREYSFFHQLLKLRKKNWDQKWSQFFSSLFYANLRRNSKKWCSSGVVTLFYSFSAIIFQTIEAQSHIVDNKAHFSKYEPFETISKRKQEELQKKAITQNHAKLDSYQNSEVFSGRSECSYQKSWVFMDSPPILLPIQYNRSGRILQQAKRIWYA